MYLLIYVAEHRVLSLSSDVLTTSEEQKNYHVCLYVIIGTTTNANWKEIAVKFYN